MILYYLENIDVVKCWEITFSFKNGTSLLLKYVSKAFLQDACKKLILSSLKRILYKVEKLARNCKENLLIIFEVIYCWCF